ncbi:universal stress protein [uncultured Draconibacterium sp.]|uniref:universal stress protein n=1 Tax=uncultured Draconibacterium sp. TaxID=1573823 RepID=UPI0025D6DFC1|nr:universal stress protein [uncultured Draconibacterium sp.]
MKVLSSVLWAVDLANNHSESINKIRLISGNFGNEIILLHVLPKHIKGGASAKKIEKSVRFELQNTIVSQLNLAEEYKVRIRIEYGNIADQINKVADEENVNIVLINKGKTEILGTNGLSTYRKIQKPIAVISNIESASQAHIVVPVNNSKASAVALKSAILHARKFDAKLSVISVFEPVLYSSPRLLRLGLDPEKENKQHHMNFKRELKEFLRQFDFSNVDAEAYILKGKADEQIIKFCDEATILYVGSGGKSEIQRAFQGSVSENVIQNVQCNVVSVKNENVFKLRISKGGENIAKHFNRGNELRKLGFKQEAIIQYKAGLKLNELHLPSIQALANAYDEMGDKEQTKHYNELSQLLKNNLTYRKIEEEVRRNFKTVS